MNAPSPHIDFTPLEVVEFEPIRGLTVGNFTPDHRPDGSDERHSQVQLVPQAELPRFWEAMDVDNPDDHSAYGFTLTAPGDELFYWLVNVKDRVNGLGYTLFEEKLTLQALTSVTSHRLSLSRYSKLRSQVK